MKVTSFTYLNLTQFFSALNDNIYKLLLIFFLINLKGTNESNSILALAGSTFVLPFILFASFAGTLSDRYSKKSVIFYTRLLEISIVAAGVVAFWLKSDWGGYTVLFLMATQSALFSPSKYGIVPELVPSESISRCNGILTATTYLAIIIGTFLASFLTQITDKNFVLAVSFCFLIAILGLLTSWRIEKTKAQSPHKKFSFRIFSEVYNTLQKARKYRYLLPTMICGAYFLFVGGFTQLNVIPLGLQSLNITEVEGGYFFLITAIGIGIGSMIVGKLSGKEVELGFVPLAAFALAFTFFFIYALSSSLYSIVGLMAILGVWSGFYVVPVESFIQVASPIEDRGQILAVANFMNFSGVILASLFLVILGNGLELTASQSFFVLGWVTFLVAIIITLMMANQLLRLIVATIARYFWDLDVFHHELLNETPRLIIVERKSWLDTLVMMAILPRLIRFIVPVNLSKIRKKAITYKLLQIIPIDRAVFDADTKEAENQVQQELALGHSVCLFTSNRLAMNQFSVPKVFGEIIRPNESKTGLKGIKNLFTQSIKVRFSTKE